MTAQLAYPVQAQPFTLSGSGSSIADTVLNLKSFKDILGANLAMASFGTVGYGTIEPGNGSQEEQISFSGVTQNSDGTAQLTGVKHVLFISPFTESSGMTITHPGSTTFVISNTSAFENSLYALLQTSIASGGLPASSTQLGITKLSVDPTVLANPIAVGANDNKVPTVNASSITAGQLAALFGDNTDITLGSGNKYVTQTGVQKNTESFAASTGIANSYAVALSPIPTSLASGQVVNFIANFANVTASASTLNVNSLGAKTIKKNYNANLVTGDILAGQVVSAAYDGANFQLLSPSATTIAYDYQAFTSSGTWTKPSGLSGNEMVKVQAWGGGGGGASGTGAAREGGGGGGGAFFELNCRASDLSATETVTVGTGGAANTVGVSTTFGSRLTAYGGGGAAVPSSVAGGGGGGGGTYAVGGNSSDGTGGTGGTPLGGTPGVASTFGGGGGASTNNAGANSVFGGGGGGGGANTSSSTQIGGKSIYGGGGGAGSADVTGAAGGTSVYGGAGGASVASGTPNAGVAPGGGGGGNANGTGGAGARGEVRVWTIL